MLVNRDLFLEFAAFLAAPEWDVALLQEVPPRWAGRLARATGSEGVRTLTSRNWLRPLTFAAARLRPHLAGSWEGGSNLILVRNPAGRGEPEPEGGSGRAVVERHVGTLSWRPERRKVTMVALAGGLCVANLHANGSGRGSEADVLRAAELSAGWAGGRPLVLGGDLNARPRSSEVFDRLEREFGLSGATAPGSIDHLLVRGVDADPPEAWPAERRDVPDEQTGLMIRLSDHAPVVRSISV